MLEGYKPQRHTHQESLPKPHKEKKWTNKKVASVLKATSKPYIESFIPVTKDDAGRGKANQNLKEIRLTEKEGGVSWYFLK